MLTDNRNLKKSQEEVKESTNKLLIILMENKLLMIFIKNLENYLIDNVGMSRDEAGLEKGN